VRQLLAFSRKQTLRPEVLNLTDVLADLRMLLSRLVGNDIKLKVDHGRDLWPVRADIGQFEQVVVNLAVNARDAMPRGGQLTLETANVTVDESYVTKFPELTPGAYVMLAVSDTGTGMDAETRRRLFEPFYTTKEPGKGTGLGLSTVYGIVKQSGGHIWVYSEPGRGATFKIYLPVVNEAADVAVVTPSDDVPRGTETILLVEDESDVRALVRQVLQERGYRVVEASGPREALHLVSDVATPIDLLLTDVIMPQMTGRVLADILTAEQPAMPVLFMSGYADSAVIEQGVLQAGRAYLQKPFTPVQLARVVRRVLDIVKV
jgi:two-component system, cell cycle sensor histidine kinase and response regulator CckA